MHIYEGLSVKEDRRKTWRPFDIRRATLVTFKAAACDQFNKG